MVAQKYLIGQEYSHDLDSCPTGLMFLRNEKILACPAVTSACLWWMERQEGSREFLGVKTIGA